MTICWWMELMLETTFRNDARFLVSVHHLD